MASAVGCGSTSSRGRGHPPRPRSRLARGQPRPCEPRSAEGDECDRAPPHGSASADIAARCENVACGHTLIAFNSCRNRHCPKCQTAASRRWLADREAELLPVPYFHVVYTLPSKLRDIAYQNKRVVYDLLMKAAAETTLAIAADPEAPRCADRYYRRAAHVGLGTHPSSARAYDRAGRRLSSTTRDG